MQSKPRSECPALRKLGLVLFALAAASAVRGQTPDPALNALVKKGFLTQEEAKAAWAEAAATNTTSASKWKISNALKQIELFGDLRFRYEYRSAANAPGSGESGDNYIRERFRYAARIGVRGDLFDNFYYGLRIETSSNPRSPWVTFGDDTNPTPSAKNSDSIGIGQAFVGWRPADWCDLTVGKMPMPLYVTPMIWDSDINPEGASEKFKVTVGRVDLFANFGQFVYQDTNPDTAIPSSDTFLLAWQVGANFRFPKDMSFKFAPVMYNYMGNGQTAGLPGPYTGQGNNGLNPNVSPTYNQTGINNLLVLETPVEFNFKLNKYKARVFGDFAYNFEGADRAQNAFNAAAAAQPPLLQAYPNDNKAYQVGFGLGNLGLVYGQTSKKNTWEIRTYWQHVEQYAADVNLLDSDFFEGRANLQGVYVAVAYSLTDAIIGTFRYGYAQPINSNLGTGGNNPDLPVLNPIRNYNLLQLDLTCRF